MFYHTQCIWHSRAGFLPATDAALRSAKGTEGQKLKGTGGTVALRHIEKQLFICTVWGQQRQFLENTWGPILAFYIMLKHKESRWLTPGYPGNTDLHQTFQYAKVLFQTLIYISFAKTQISFPHASNYSASTSPVHSSLFLLRSPCYPGWTFHTESHALTVEIFSM